MATLGSSTAAPNSSSYWTFNNVQNQVWGGYTMPNPGGYVTSISAYFDTNGGTSTCYVCVWDFNGGQLLASVAISGVPAGSHTPGQQWWWTGTLGSSLWIAGNRQIGIGFWVPDNNGFVTSSFASGSAFWNQQASAPGSSSNGTAPFNAIGSYVTYTPLAAPTISSISPSVAPPGTSGVVLTGTNLLQVTSLTVGGVAASFAVNSDTQITFTVPSSVGGVVTVTATNAAGSGSSSMTAGQIYVGDASGNGAVHSLISAKVGDSSGNGTVHPLVGVWVPNGGGTKRIW